MLRTITLAAALLASAGVASAQTASENYSYSAPSGMFGDGTTKWNLYRFMHEDAERTARLRAGEELTTGSVQGSAVGPNQYRRPGERGARRR